jgi:hypothetical protein
MKKNLVLLLLPVLLCLAIPSDAQTIRIADNNATRPTGANIFPLLQDAINASSPGDIVYVQPSTTTYGNITIDRPITLRGIGFNTLKDIALTSIVGNIGLTNTISNATNASGTTIEGLITNNIYLGYQTGTFSYVIQNITVSNCQIYFLWRDNAYMTGKNITIQNNNIYFSVFANANLSQLQIYQNYISGGMTFGEIDGGGNPNNYGGIGVGGTLSSVIISNNIFGQGTFNQFNATISSMAVTNNLFFAGTNIGGSRMFSSDYWGGAGLTDAIVSNNIFYGTAPTSTASPFERNSFLNNMTFGTSNDALPPAGSGVGNTGTGNLISIDPKFTSATFGTAYSATMNFTLQAGSPAKNAGTDGTDIGITGGPYPLTNGNFSLHPSHTPVIMTLNPAVIVPQGQPLKTNIKAKSY